MSQFVEVKQQTEADQMKRAFVKTMVAVASQIPLIPTRPLIEQVTPAIPHVAEAAIALNDWLTDEDLIKFYNRIAHFYQGQGAYAQALHWLEQGQKIAEKRLGKNHPDIAIIIDSLAGVYQAQGLYTEAEKLQLQSLQIAEQLGTDHSYFTIYLSNLADIYRIQGRYAEAESLLSRLL
ncbi:tetratricopeptide repeat protein [Nostoc sp. CHAB 5834]|nr:tetratricopeptide repeat protein [Nostoc sp. CHAB 5834]